MKKLVICLMFFVPFSFAQTNYARMLNGVNYQTGTTYTFTAADGLRITQFNNASPVAATLPNGNTLGFQAGSVFSMRNAGAGTVTVTCSSCTINGSGTVTLTTGQAFDLYSDGLNFVGNQVNGSTFTLPSASQTTQALVSTGAGTTYTAQAFAPPSPNPTVYYASRNCGSMTNCTQIKADGRYVIDATSNSTTTITCPNNDCNFTAADVGKTVWATTQGSAGSLSFLIYTTYVCPVTTISTVNSAQSITVGTACTASGTANVALYWATDDGTALSGLDAAAGCANIYLPDPGPTGLYILTSQPFLVNAPSASLCNQQITAIVGAPAPALIGTGFGASSSILMIHPNFVWANCKAIPLASLNVCIGGTARSISNLQVWGSGLTSASNSTGCSGAANKILVSASPVSAVMYGVDVAGVCPGASGMVGVEMNAFDESFDLGGAQEVGSIACQANHASAIVMREADCHNFNVSGGVGLNVGSSAQMSDLSSYPVSVATVGGSLNSRGTHFVAGNGGSSPVTVTGTWISYGDFVGTDSGFGTPTSALVINGGTVQSANTVFGLNQSISNQGGKFISLGGNKTISTNGTSLSTSTWYGPDVFVGTCRGTATSSSTLTLYQMGEWTANTCTVAAPGAGSFVGRVVTIVPLSGFVHDLQVNAGTGCKSGNTCVFTLMKNGSATTLTCSMTGGAAFCQDVAHNDVPAAGDTYSIQFTTGATETLANITATLLVW